MKKGDQLGKRPDSVWLVGIAHHPTGTYDLSLTAANECGSITYTDVVDAAPSVFEAGFSVADPVTCAPAQVQYLNASSSADTLRFAWQFPGGTPATSTEKDPLVLYPLAGDYDVELHVAAFGGEALLTAPNFLQVDTLPSATFEVTAADASTVSFSSSVAAPFSTPTLLWDFGDGQVSTSPHPTHTYSEGGDYVVALMATNACGSVTTSRSISVSVTSAPMAPSASGLSVSPNPARSTLYLSFRQPPTPPCILYLIAADGRQLHHQELSPTSFAKEIPIDVGGLPAGSYQLRVSTGARTISHSFVKL